jgi:transketolase
VRNTCLEQIYELAKKDNRVVFIGSDLRLGTLQQFKDEFPNRYFMEGVCEQNIIGMAAGLALDGFIPYVNTIATFLTRRCYEQVCLDLGLHDLPVRLIGNGGGLVYAPLGPTHLAIDDIALMRNIPNMTIVCPSDAEEMKDLMPQTLDYPHPMYIRIGRGFVDPVVYTNDFKIGAAKIVSRGYSHKTIVSTGLTTDIAIKIAKRIDANVLHVPTIKPFPSNYLCKLANDSREFIVIEEHSLCGGLGSAILECLADNDIQIPVKRFGIPDAFPARYGTWDTLMEHYGLTTEKILEQL